MCNYWITYESIRLSGHAPNCSFAGNIISINLRYFFQVVCWHLSLEWGIRLGSGFQRRSGFILDVVWLEMLLLSTYHSSGPKWVVLRLRACPSFLPPVPPGLGTVSSTLMSPYGIPQWSHHIPYECWEKKVPGCELSPSLLLCIRHHVTFEFTSTVLRLYLGNMRSIFSTFRCG